MHSAILRVSVAAWKLFTNEVFARQPTPPSLILLAGRARDEGLISDSTHNAVVGVSVMYDLAMGSPGRVSAEKELKFMPLADAVLYAPPSAG